MWIFLPISKSQQVAFLWASFSIHFSPLQANYKERNTENTASAQILELIQKSSGTAKQLVYILSYGYQPHR